MLCSAQDTELAKESTMTGRIKLCVCAVTAAIGARGDTGMLMREAFTTPAALDRWELAGGKPQFMSGGGPRKGSNAVRFSVAREFGDSTAALSLNPEDFRGGITFECMMRGVNLMRYQMGVKRAMRNGFRGDASTRAGNAFQGQCQHLRLRSAERTRCRTFCKGHEESMALYGANDG